MHMHSLSRTIFLAVLVATVAAPICAADDYVGWRTDGTGIYPDATPVTTWSDEANIIWQTPMPGSSNSLPVIVGDRLFVCSDPATLVCMDKNTGEIAWEAPNTPADIASAEDVADLAEKTAEYNRLRGEIGKAGSQMRKLRKQLQDDPDNAELKQQVQELREQMNTLNEQMAPLKNTWYVTPPTHGYSGYSSPTPISDGEHVWVVFGSGIAACYDLDGNRVWARFIEKPPHDWGTSNTPVLADGKLILHINVMRALDPLTGEEVWAQPEARWNWGTSWVHDYDGVPVIFTSSGNAVRAEDGAIIASGLGRLQWGSGPMVVDGVLYYIDSQPKGATSRALRLPETLDEPFEPELLWEVTPKQDRYYASPIIADGLIYAITQVGVLTCLDAETGETVYEQSLQFGKGAIFASLVLAGDYLIATHENGTSIVFEAGREYVEVATNQLSDMVRSTPVFDGDLMYVRGYENMYCIGAVE